MRTAGIAEVGNRQVMERWQRDLIGGSQVSLSLIQHGRQEFTYVVARPGCVQGQPDRLDPMMKCSYPVPVFVRHTTRIPARNRFKLTPPARRRFEAQTSPGK